MEQCKRIAFRLNLLNNMTKKIGAGILLINSKNELLLLLRDNRPDIPYPDKWDIPGGHVEIGETPGETIRREMIEEMSLELGEIKLFRIYEEDDLIDNLFWKRIELNPDEIDLKEGQRLAYFSRDQIAQMQLAFNYNTVVKDFYNFILSENE